MNLALSMLTNQSSGGLAGFLPQFEAIGLGNVANSWVSTGHNLPIAVDQIQPVFGVAQLQEMAARLGLSPGALSGPLADVLPQEVGKATPNGTVPDQSSLEQGLSGLLQGFLNK